MICGNCHHDPCHCGTKRRLVWRPSTTVARACRLIHSLLLSQECSTSCPDNELCQLLQFECDICGGRYPIAALAMMVAARLLEREAIAYARHGSVKTLTVSVNGNQSASELREIADMWRKQAIACVPKPKFAIVATGTSCLSTAQSAYHHCGCHEKIIPRDMEVLTSCHFGCCDDCE